MHMVCMCTNIKIDNIDNIVTYIDRYRYKYK